MEELDKILQKFTSDSDVPNALRGASFTAFTKDGLTYSKAFGSRTIDASEEAPFQMDSVQWIASLSKLFTAVACMIAVEQNLIGLDDNVREIVPELKTLDILLGFEESQQKPRKPVLEKVTAPITLRQVGIASLNGFHSAKAALLTHNSQLLSHSSGFAYDHISPPLIEWSEYIGRKENTFTGNFEGYTLPLLFQPGQGWAYGPSLDWAGRTIEVVSGKTLEEYMQYNIFTKLDMRDTTFRPELRSDFSQRRMDMAWRNRATNELSIGKVPLANPCEACCGGTGLYSTPEDCAKVLKALFDGGKPILQISSIDEIMKPQVEDKKYFLEAATGVSRGQLAQTWPIGITDASFGLSSSIALEDFPNRRAKNSANWSGMPGVHAWLDRKNGVAGLLTTQVLPPGDPMVTECFLELEKAVYRSLPTYSPTCNGHE